MRMGVRYFTNLTEKVLQFLKFNLEISKIELKLKFWSYVSKEGLLDNLTFQGGTSLRLCYGAPRFSEDLDFVGGHDFASQQLMVIKDCIEHYIGKRYELEVTVKPPSALKKQNTLVCILNSLNCIDRTVNCGWQLLKCKLQYAHGWDHQKRYFRPVDKEIARS